MKNVLLIILMLISGAVIGQDDGWNISTTKTSNYTGIVVANGRIGILPAAQPFEVKQIILNNVY